MSASTVAVDASNWESEVVKSSVPVLVDFWAEWCGPCRALAPALDELSVEMAGKLKVVKVDIDENRQLAVQFNVASIPTLLLLKEGKEQARMVGLMSKVALQAKIAQSI
ncbi:MAG: thioredoxin [bacterium]